MDDTNDPADRHGAAPSGRANPPDPANQRGAERFSLLIRTAKLVYPNGEFLCVVRDVSATGVRLRLFHPLPAQTTAELELANGDRHRLEWVWEESGHAGFRFAAEINVPSFVNEASNWARRPIRLRLHLPVALTTGGAAQVAWLYNLSQHGARVECGQPLAERQKVRLEAEGLPPLIANVAWRASRCHGLVFQQGFTFAALATLAANLQAGAAPGQRPYAGRNSSASPFMQ